jgi:hypothetical protein
MYPRTLAPLRSRLAATGSRIGYAVWFPLTVYAITRLVDVVFILIAARHQVDLPHEAIYGSVASNWDGQWYLGIASHGYPTTIPRDPGGHALQNPWGFYPAYPFIAGAIMRISGLAFAVVAPILSFVLGAGAVIVMYRLINQGSGRFAASATVLLTCTYMAAPAMQIAYTESLALLLVCSALLLLRNRRYGWLVPVMVMLALTRAIALAFVPVLVVHGISRYRHRSLESFPEPERLRVAVLTALAIVLTGLWPAIAAITTRDPAAYTQTMSSWGTTGKLRVLIEFPAFAWAAGGAVGLAGLLAIITLIAVIVLRRGAKAWDPEVRAWAGFYPLYLLLATAPGSSNIRHLFLAFPLMWPFPQVAASTTDRHRRVAVMAILAVCGLIMQWVWISQYLVLTGPPDVGHIP